MPQMVSRGLASTRVVPLVAISDARSAGFCVNCAVTLIWVWARNYYMIRTLALLASRTIGRHCSLHLTSLNPRTFLPSALCLRGSLVSIIRSAISSSLKRPVRNGFCLTQRCILHHAPFPGSYVLSGASYIARRSRIPHQLH